MKFAKKYVLTLRQNNLGKCKKYTFYYHIMNTISFMTIPPPKCQCIYNCTFFGKLILIIHVINSKLLQTISNSNFTLQQQN